METFFTLSIVGDTMKNSQPSNMNIVCRWDVMISLLMTMHGMGYVVVDISKEVFMVGKRFSMVVTLEVKQLNISVEKMSVPLQRIIPPLLFYRL